MRWIVSVVFVLFAMGSFGAGNIGCGDGACGQATELMCKKACDCGDGTDGCKISANSIVIRFDDEGGCNAFFDFACDNDESDIDWNQCSVALASTKCDADAVISPPACN